MNDVTALVRTEQDLKPTINQLIKDLQSYNPKKDNQYLEEGTFLITRFANAKDQIENLRLSFTKPLNESLKKINAFFKTFSSPIEEADRQLRNKLLEFRKEKEAEAIKEAQNNNVEVPELRKKIGGIVAKKVWKWKLTDITKVPDEYFTIAPDRINDAIRAGVRKIPGIEIFQDSIISR